MPMRTSCFLVLWFLSLHAPVHPQTVSSSAIELVESIPVETDLDNPDIRNTQEVWLEMINAAKATLDIEQFYIANKPHEPLEDVIQAIERAAHNGVHVRIIADARFYKTYPQTIDRLGKQKGIAVRMIDYGKLAGGVQHAKFFIVDGQEVFLGSQNFDWRALKHIHELGLRIRHSEVVRFYLDLFDLDWQLAQTNDKSVLPKYLSRKNYTFPVAVTYDSDTLFLIPTASPIGFIPDTSLWDELHIIRLIDGARQEASLQFLGYDTRARDRSEYRVLDDALRRAAARGVNVRLLVSDWEKGTPAERALKELSTVANIEVKFSVIPEWSGGYVSFARVGHCKFIVVDGKRFWLGSSNAEKSYFYTSRNLGVVVESPTFARRLEEIFRKSWDGPYAEPIRVDATYKPRKHDGE